MLTCINATLWRHYEYGLKMPRQENLEKIAQALDVPMQMLFPIDTCTPVGIATLLLNMQLQFGSMEIVEVDGSVSLKFPKNEFSKNEIGAEIKEKRELWKEILDGRMDESSIPEGESWLYLEDTAGSIEEATYRLKNMALLDYITECYKTKKGSQ